MSSPITILKLSSYSIMDPPPCKEIQTLKKTLNQPTPPRILYKGFSDQYGKPGRHQVMFKEDHKLCYHRILLSFPLKI